MVPVRNIQNTPYHLCHWPSFCFFPFFSFFSLRHFCSGLSFCCTKHPNSLWRDAELIQLHFVAATKTAWMMLTTNQGDSPFNEDKTLSSLAKELSLGQQREHLVKAVRMQVTFGSYLAAAWMKDKEKSFVLQGKQDVVYFGEEAVTWGSKKNNWSGLAVRMQVTFRSYPETARMKKHKRASSLKEDKTLCSSARNLSLVGSKKNNWSGLAVRMQVTFRTYPETARMKKQKRASSLKEDKTLYSSARNLSLVGQQKEQLIQAVRMQVTSQSYPEAAWMKRQRKNLQRRQVRRCPVWRGSCHWWR